MTDRVRKFLDLSTEYLPPAMLNGLTGIENVVAYPTEYGAWLWVPDNPDESNEAMESPIPPEILRIQRHARSLGCDYVLFDAEGETTTQLPSYKEQW